MIEVATGSVRTTRPRPAASGVVPLCDDEVDRFVRRLRGGFDDVYPSGWQMDWSHLPSPFRWYPGLPAVALPGVSRQAARGGTAAGADLAATPQPMWLGGYLQACYGVTGIRWHPSGLAKSSPDEPRSVHRDPHYQLRRPVPSGGVTYPTECYVTVPGSVELPAGTYHYNAVRHALVRLPVPARRQRPGTARILLTTPLWKNYFKYSDFCYRLGALDAGAVLGQFESVARRWGWSCSIRFGIDEPAVLAHLGLDARDEAVVAALDVDPHNATPPAAEPPEPYPASDRIADWRGAAQRPPDDSGAVRMHAACLVARAGTATIDLPSLAMPAGLRAAEPVRLPDVAAAPRSVATSWSRTALGEQFRATALSITDLAGLLSPAMVPVAGDLAGTPGQIRCVVLAKNVVGLAVGAHVAQPDNTLVSLRDGDFGPVVARSMFGQYMNLAQAPLIVLLAGAATSHRGVCGPLGYRVQHHLAGLVAQRMVVAAAGLGLSGHPMLGFDSRAVDQPVGLAALGWTSLLVVAFGRFRRSLYLESSVSPVAAWAGQEVRS